ncbi:MAG: ABC transporter ATP-binding protein [Campylobacterota bacterium]|nr:ABC transporter ATP-binding protein [Campylobacterota bacterium]
MIELKNLKCAFDGRTILENVSLNIESHLSILGANGSGKSTLAKAICSLTPYDGEVSINATNTKELSLNEKAKLISYIPAKLEIYDSFITVEEFVLLGRFPYKKSFFEYSDKDKNIASQTLEFLKISHLKYSSVDSLSSGEQQLTLIAQALAQQSKIIIFDEPTANLDPHNSKVIAEHIKGLKEYHQIILITHDLHLASYVNSPVAFIKERTTHYYEENFFDDTTLQELYGVSFNSLVPQYD